MNDLQRSRYISKRVRRQLLEDARGRCCVSRELLVPGETRLKKLARVLQKHHVVHFAHDGPNTEDNLILICPNCHELIHRFPEQYPNDRLIELKRHWIGMSAVVPSRLPHPDCLGLAADSTRQLALGIETLGLKYTLTVPRRLTVGELTEFVVQAVLTPLGEYDGYANWIRPHTVRLATASKPLIPLAGDLLVDELALSESDWLTLIVHVPTQAALNDNLQLNVEPPTPVARQPYVVMLQLSPAWQAEPVAIEIRGTDGFSLNQSGVPDAHGRYSIQISGGQAGVVDRIRGTVSGITAVVTIIFTEP